MLVLLSHPDQIQDVIFGDEGVMKGWLSPRFFTPQLINFTSELMCRKLYASFLCRSTEGCCIAFVFDNIAFAPPEARETTYRLQF